jgi:hypothetical protein
VANGLAQVECSVWVKQRADGKEWYLCNVETDNAELAIDTALLLYSHLVRSGFVYWRAARIALLSATI